MTLTLSIVGGACGTGREGNSAPADVGSTAAPSSAVPASAPSPTTQAPPGNPDALAFRSSTRPIDAETTERMSSSWRPGCPVDLEDLRLVTVSHWDFEGRQRQGDLVVHRDQADAVISVFRELHDGRFPVEQIRLVDEFGGDDDRSMAANNTSAFNCRRATGSSRWSEHAYGRAIDINPVQNPYVTSSGAVLPPAGRDHRTRDPAVTGLITSEGPVVAAFDRIGWGWGGRWSKGKDYQHFSASGR